VPSGVAEQDAVCGERGCRATRVLGGSGITSTGQSVLPDHGAAGHRRGQRAPPNSLRTRLIRRPASDLERLLHAPSRTPSTLEAGVRQEGEGTYHERPAKFPALSWLPPWQAPDVYPQGAPLFTRAVRSDWSWECRPLPWGSVRRPSWRNPRPGTATGTCTSPVQQNPGRPRSRSFDRLRVVTERACPGRPQGCLASLPVERRGRVAVLNDLIGDQARHGGQAHELNPAMDVELPVEVREV
jgi:hypothetical protein